MAEYPICSQVSWLELYLEQKIFLPEQSVSLSEQTRLCSGDGFSVSLPSHLLLASSQLARRTFLPGEVAQDVLLPSIRGATLLLLVEILRSGMSSNMAMTESMGDSLRDIKEVMKLLDIPGCVGMIRVQNKIQSKFKGNEKQIVLAKEDVVPDRMEAGAPKLEIVVDLDETTGTDLPGSSHIIDEISSKAGVSRECHICKQIYPNWKSWTSHVRKIHNEALFPCTHCGMKFVLEKTLKEHSYREHGGDGIGCEYCHYTYKSRELLNAHMYKRHRTEMISCRFCSRRFIHKDTLKIHMKKNHKQEQFQLRNRESRQRPVREKFVFSPNTKVKKPPQTETVAEALSVQNIIPHKLQAEKSSKDRHSVPLIARP